MKKFVQRQPLTWCHLWFIHFNSRFIYTPERNFFFLHRSQLRGTVWAVCVQVLHHDSRTDDCVTMPSHSDGNIDRRKRQHAGANDIDHGWRGRESERSTWGTPTSFASSNRWIIKTLQPWKLYDSWYILSRNSWRLSRASGFVYQEFVLLYGHQLKGQRRGMDPVDIGPVLLAILVCSSETTGYQRPLQTIAADHTTGQSRACVCAGRQSIGCDKRHLAGVKRYCPRVWRENWKWERRRCRLRLADKMTADSNKKK